MSRPNTAPTNLYEVKKMQAFNPYLPGYEYVPDGEPYVFGDRVYVYGSHDHFNGKDFCLGDYVCWSASVDDLGDWRCDGVIYRRNQDPQNADGKWVMNAPDVERGADGRYYLYYQISRLSTVSVAVSDTPDGPFAYYGTVHYPDGHALGRKPGEVYCFDPAVLREDDGKVYLYVGFSPDKGIFRSLMEKMKLNFDGGFGVELESDMLTVKGEPQLVAPGPILAEGTPYAGHGFYEASSIRKIDGKYYFVYSSILSHELCYAIGDKPFGPFTYGGTLVSNGDVGYKGRTEPDNYPGNTHGGMVNIKGQWYIFYHRQTNKQKCARQGCAEKLTILPDGSIPQVEMTSCGLNDGPLNGLGFYEARIACNLYAKEGTIFYKKSFEKDKKKVHPYFTQTGPDRNIDSDQHIANMRDGSVAGFKYFAMGKAAHIRLRTRGGNGRMLVYTDLNGKPAAEIELADSAAWHTSAPAQFTCGQGVKPLYFVWHGEQPLDFYGFELME